MATTKIWGATQIADASISEAKLADTFIRADGANAFTGDQSLGSNKLTNVADPTAAQDAATKNYVDSVAQGISAKTPVRAATTAAGTLSSDFENGDTIDGITLSTGDRILIKDQGTGSENGIYVVNATGAPTRAVDLDVDSELVGAITVFVQEGTTNADSGYLLASDGTLTVGTSAQSWTQFTGAGQITAGAGLSKTGNTIDVVAADASITVNANDIQVAVDGTAGTIAVGGAGLQVADGTAGQILIGQGAGVDTAFTALSGDVSAVAANGAVTLSTDVLKASKRVADSFTGDGSTTAFTLTGTALDVDVIDVYDGGLMQLVGGANDYTTTTTVVTFNTAPVTGSNIVVKYWTA